MTPPPRPDVLRAALTDEVLLHAYAETSRHWLQNTEGRPEDEFRSIRVKSLEVMRDVLVAALSAALAAPPEDGWQPIETAPKDGTKVLVCKWPLQGPNPEKHFGIFVQRAAWWSNEGDDGAWIVYNDMVQDPECHFTPTHWQPLPAPPDETREDGPRP